MKVDNSCNYPRHFILLKSVNALTPKLKEMCQFAGDGGCRTSGDTVLAILSGRTDNVHESLQEQAYDR